jgi:hypothetical protein
VFIHGPSTFGSFCRCEKPEAERQERDKNTIADIPSTARQLEYFMNPLGKTALHNRVDPFFGITLFRNNAGAVTN